MRRFGGLFFGIFTLVSLTTQRSPANIFPGCISSNARSIHRLQAFEDIATRRIVLANVGTPPKGRLDALFVDRRFQSSPMKKDLVMSSENSSSAALTAQELISGAPYRDLRTGLPYTPKGNEKVYASFDFAATQRQEMLSASPSAFKRRIEELKKKSHLLDASIRFPAESTKFFIALGAVAYLNATNHHSQSPLAFQQLLDQQTDPIGHFGFLAFIYANARCGAALQPMLSNSRLRFFAGYLGMACGMTASNIVHELGFFAPEILTVFRQSFANPGSLGEEKKLAALDAAYNKWTEMSLSQKLGREWMPGLSSLFASTFAAGVSEALICTGAGVAGAGMARVLPKAVSKTVFGIDLLLNFIPTNGARGIVFKALTWAVRDIPKFAVFLYMSEVMSEPFTMAWESWFRSGPGLKQSEGFVKNLLARGSESGSFQELPDAYTKNDGQSAQWVQKCRNLDEALDETRCFSDLDLEILRYQELNRTYREVLIGDLLMAQSNWATKLAELSNQYRISSQTLKLLQFDLQRVREERLRKSQASPGTAVDTPMIEFLTQPEPFFGVQALSFPMTDPFEFLKGNDRDQFRQAQRRNLQEIGQILLGWLHTRSSHLESLLPRIQGEKAIHPKSDEFRGSQVQSNMLSEEEKSLLTKLALSLQNGTETQIGERLDWLNLALTPCARLGGCDFSTNNPLAKFSNQFQGLQTRYLKHQKEIPQKIGYNFLSVLKLIRSSIGQPEPLWGPGDAYVRLLTGKIYVDKNSFGTHLEDLVYSGPRSPNHVDNAIAGFYFGPSPLRQGDLIIQASSADLLGRPAPDIMDPLRWIGYGFPARLLTPRLIEPDPVLIRVRSGALRPSPVRGYEPIEKFVERTPFQLSASMEDFEIRASLQDDTPKFDLFPRLLQKMELEIERNSQVKTPTPGLLGKSVEGSDEDAYWDLHMNSRFLDAWILFERSYMEVIADLSKAYWEGRRATSKSEVSWHNPLYVFAGAKDIMNLVLPERPSLKSSMDKEMQQYEQIVWDVVKAKLKKMPELKSVSFAGPPPSQSLLEAYPELQNVRNQQIAAQQINTSERSANNNGLVDWGVALTGILQETRGLFEEINRFFAQISYEEKKIPLAIKKGASRLVSVTRIDVNKFSEKVQELQMRLLKAQSLVDLCTAPPPSEEDVYQHGAPGQNGCTTLKKPVFLNDLELRILINALQGLRGLTQEMSNYAQVVNQVSYVAKYGSESGQSMPSPCIDTIRKNFQAFGLSLAQKKKLCGE
ncbi:MAG: hypothetical protein WCH11_00990 [Bdellovibrio sp.]